MGCFCRQAVDRLCEDAGGDGTRVHPAIPDSPAVTLAGAASAWLAARWLPAPPWRPDPAWRDAAIPDAPLRPEAMTVLSGLVQAREACRSALGTDPADPAQAPKLARIVETLNRRGDALRALDADRRPWSALAALAGQADAIRAGAAQGAFLPQHPGDAPEEPIGPWRTLLGRLKALAPLIATGQALKADLARGDLPELLADLVRKLRTMSLPALDDPDLVMRLVARADAVGRLQRSLGADPQGVPFARVQGAVMRRLDSALALLPPALQHRDGRLQNAPDRPPNPGQLINADVMQAAQSLPPGSLARMQWQVPDWSQFDLLRTAAPVASLVAALGPAAGAVRSAPCGPGCDA